MSTRPTNFDGIVGQTSAKTVVETLLKASVILDKSIPHILFSGPAGCGKTTFSRVIADYKKAKCFEINASMIKSVDDLLSIFKRVNRFDIVFIDEIHALSNKCFTIAFNIMEDFYFTYVEKKQIVRYNLPNITIIGATTHLGLLPKPLQDRFKYVAEFVEYNQDELVEIVFGVCKSYNFKLNEKVARVIANTCRNIPRHVVSRTEWIRDYMIANEVKSLKVEDVVNIIKLQGFDKNGLQNADHRYLKCLQQAAALSLNQLCSKLSLDSSTVSETIEPYLLKENYIEITKRGRKITRKGVEVCCHY